MASKHYLSLACAVLVAGLSPPLRALDDSDKEPIRVLSNDAANDYNESRYEAALDKFSRAYKLARVPRLAVWAARCNVKLGRLVAAYELYRQARAMEPNDLWRGDAQQRAQQEAETELQALQPRLARITISAVGAEAKDVTISIDGVGVPSALLGVERLADPGTREVIGKLGVQVVRERLKLAEGDRQQIVLRFQPVPGRETAPDQTPAPSEPPNNSVPSVSPTVSASSAQASDRRAWGWAGVGVGVAALAVGLTTGALVADKYGYLKDRCGGDARTCGPEQESDVRTYHTLQAASTAGLIVGGLATAVGATLLVTTPKQESNSTLGWWMSPTQTGFRGTF